MANNSSSKLAHVVPILCQNWQFWGPNCIANKKNWQFFAKILKFCLLQNRIGQKFEYFSQKIAKLAIISTILAPKLPFFIIRYSQTNLIFIHYSRTMKIRIKCEAQTAVYGTNSWDFSLLLIIFSIFTLQPIFDKFFW